MITRRFATLAVMVFALNLALPFAPKQAHAETTAQSFIEGLSDEAVKALTTEGVERSERIVRFTELLHQNFDTKLIGKWVLGPFWRRASQEERDEYFDLFEQYLVIKYVNRFEQYSGEKLHVVKSVGDPVKDVLVYTEIRRPTGGEPIKVNWRVRFKDEAYKIIDVYVGSISMSETQRDEFTAILGAKGGKVSALIEVMREKIDTLNAEAAANEATAN